MVSPIRDVSEDECTYILSLSENYFYDFKSKEISPGKITKALSAFSNATGGEVYVGIKEVMTSNGQSLEWSGFINEEEANGFFQTLQQLDPLGNIFKTEFLKNDSKNGILLHIIISKSKNIVTATDGKVYVRHNAASLPLKPEDINKLKFDKGIQSYEDEIIDVSLDTICNSARVIEFFLDTIPNAEPEIWLKKQSIIINEKPTVASILLFSDYPQSVMAKNSAIKILRYQTKNDADRDYLSFTPLTIEGPIYDLIYSAVAQTKEEIEKIEKIGVNGMEKISYPPEALHEVVTNAILHRDYSIISDVQIRIFDNRVEVESPGRLPGHVTLQNIQDTQFARNPKIVRLINKFKNPPNKDVGEGINTVFESMNKLRLKEPIFTETQNSLIVTLKHEGLASPEQIVMDYLENNPSITNSIARDITGIKSENSMKLVFYRLRDKGEIELPPRKKGMQFSWVKKQKFDDNG